MKVIDRYDYDENLKERYCGTTFLMSDKTEYKGKTHGYSYLHCRNLYEESGEIMGLENECTHKRSTLR